jgi:signal transduction histidine kinase
VALPRLLRTSSFRLTLLYAGLFGASVLILFGVIYWATDIYMTGSLDADVDSDLAELDGTFRTGGISSLAALIEERVRQSPKGPMHYLLEDADGQIIAGNLPASASPGGRFDLSLPSPDPHHDHRLSLRGRDLELPGGAHLILAVDAQLRTEMHELILRAFGWGSAITLVLAFGGGAVISGSLLRRIETIARTAREIMAGDFSRRIPVRGTDDEFDHLVVSLNAMLDQIDASLESLRHISNDIAHDLRTPLTRLRQRLELAQCRAQSVDEWRSAGAACIGEMDAILETFGALLRIAQIESGAAARNFAEVDLSGLLQTMIEIYEPMAEEKGQRLAAEIPAGLAAWGDRELLAQMLANLIENAMKHSPEGATVDLVAASTAAGVDIAVIDNGPGIPEAERRHVFDRFYRVEHSRSTPGAGLGLSLVKAIAVRHRVTVELSNNNPGLRVAVHFPPMPSNPRPSAASLAFCRAADDDPGKRPTTGQR